MNSRTLTDTWFGRAFARLMAAILESRLRYRLLPPERALTGAGVHAGQAVLEVGCGTGYYTLPAARLVGDEGRLVAIDVLPASVAAVTAKVQAAGLTNTRVIQVDVLDTRLDEESIDVVMIFGVIPAPMLPMDRLLAEMHRIIRPGGTMAVWPPSWVHWTIGRSPLFAYTGRRHGVLTYLRW